MAQVVEQGQPLMLGISDPLAQSVMFCHASCDSSTGIEYASEWVTERLSVLCTKVEGHYVSAFHLPSTFQSFVPNNDPQFKLAEEYGCFCIDATVQYTN